MTRKQLTPICLLIFVTGYIIGSLQNRNPSALAKPSPQADRPKIIYLERNPRNSGEGALDAHEWQDGYLRGWDVTDGNGRVICEDPYLRHKSIEIECAD